MSKSAASLLCLFSALFLVSCGTPARRVSPYQPRSPLAASYGDWQFNPSNCTIQARAPGFTLSTDGRLENGTIMLRAAFAMPLARPPVAEVSELLAPVPTEGSKTSFNIILAYDAPNAAHMLKPDTFLIIRYQPSGGADMQENSFATQGLTLALADLSTFCGK